MKKLSCSPCLSAGRAVWLRHLGFPVFVSLATLTLVARSDAGANPLNIANWPDQPDWRALTNHIQACYEAVVERYAAAGADTNAVPKPVFFLPYQDYLELGYAIDTICSAFAVSTNAIVGGDFTHFLHDTGTNSLPMWSRAGLHGFLGLEQNSWHSGMNHFTSWVICDRGIQGNIAAALGRLRYTVVSACVTGALTRTWESWDGDGGSFCTESLEGDLNHWPWGFAQSSAESLNWEAGTPCTNVSSTTAVEGIPGALQLPLHADVRWSDIEPEKPWFYRAEARLIGESAPAGSVDFRDETFGALCYSPATDVPPVLDELSSWVRLGKIGLCAPGFPLDEDRVLLAGVTECEFCTSGCGPGEPFDVSVVVTDLNTVKPYRFSGRYAPAITQLNPCATNVPSIRSLYLAGGLISSGHLMLERQAEWMPEIAALETGVFSRVHVTVATQETNSYYDAYCPTNVPYADCAAIDEMGWAVRDAFWVLDWQFKPLPASSPDLSEPRPPDTECDGLVVSPMGLSGVAEPFGSMYFAADSQEPLVCLPLATLPRTPDPLQARVDLVAGRTEGLPYRVLTGGCSASAWEPRTDRVYSPPFHLTLDTRIVETNYVNTGDQHLFQVSLLRPFGRLVVFEFPWEVNRFGTIGVPIGPDAKRSYFLERTDELVEYQSPFPPYVCYRTNCCLRLCFADGLFHDFADVGELQRVGMSDGQSAVVGKFGFFTEAGVPPPERRIVIGEGHYFIERLHGLGSFLFPGESCRYSCPTDTAPGVALGYENGLLKTLEYSNGKTIVAHVELDRSAERIAALRKSGNGFEQAGCSRSANTITHGWGNERLSSFSADANGVDSIITFESGGATWSISHSFDADWRLVSRTVASGTHEREETWQYSDADGRYVSGLARKHRVKGYTAPNGLARSYLYANDTGWLAEILSSWHSLPLEITCGYDLQGGEPPALFTGMVEVPARERNPLERPRSIEWSIDGAVVHKRLTAAYAAETNRVPCAISQQECCDSSAGWNDPDNLETLKTYAMLGSGGVYPGAGVLILRSVDGPCGWVEVSAPAGVYAVEHYDSRSEDARWNAQVDYRGAIIGWSNHRYDRASQAWVTTAAAEATEVDALGRVCRMDYRDGTFETFSDWCVHGPQAVTHRDKSTAALEYDPFGRLRKYTEPELGRVTEFSADPLALDVTTTSTQGGVTTEVRRKRDLLGRPLLLESPAQSVSWQNCTPLGCGGWWADITRDGFGDIHCAWYEDGSLWALAGPGTTRHFEQAWGVCTGQLVRSRIACTREDCPTQEQTETLFDAFGRVCEIRQNGIGTVLQVEYGTNGLPRRVLDGEEIVSIFEYDRCARLVQAGLKRSGDPEALLTGGSDRVTRLEHGVDADGSYTFAYGYPQAGSSTDVELGCVGLTHDGRHAVAGWGGHMWDGLRTPFSAPGACSDTLSMPGGRRLVTQHSLDGGFFSQALTPDGVTYAAAALDVDADGLGYEFTDSEGTDAGVRVSPDGSRICVDDRSGEGADVEIELQTGAPLPLSVVRGGERFACEPHPDGSAHFIEQTGEPRIELFRDGSGRIEEMRVQRGDTTVVTRWERDPRTGLPERKTLNGITLESYTWRRNAQLETLSRPGGVVLQYAYGDGGEVTSVCETAPGGPSQTREVEFDRLGRISAHGIRGGVSETYSRRLDGSIELCSVSGGAPGIVPDHAVYPSVDAGDGAPAGFRLTHSGAPARQLSALRAGSGRVTDITDGSISAHYTWAAGRVTGVDVSVSGSCCLSLSNAWMRSRALRTHLLWTVAGRPVASYGYSRGFGSNRIARVDCLDGSARVVGYDPDGRLEHWRYLRADGSEDTFRGYACTYDAAGNVLRCGPVDGEGEGTDVFEAGDVSFHLVRRWGAVELVGAAAPGLNVTVQGVAAERDGAAFRYRLALNERETACVTTLVVAVVEDMGAYERYAERAVELRLPARPETIESALRGVTLCDSLSEYVWDARNQLRQVIDTVAARRLRSTYDYYPDGRRARKIVEARTNNQWQVQSTHRYLYDGWNLVREETATDAGTSISDYIWGLDLKGQLSGVLDQEAGGIGGLVAVREVSGNSTNILLPVCDHLGTVQALVAAVTNSLTLPTPTVVAEYRYTPYGELVERTGPYARSCPFGFNSKYRDEETGLWYFGCRFFDSAAAKWLSLDPLAEGGGLNLSAFCRNDPVNNVDPLGLDAYMFGGTWVNDVDPMSKFYIESNIAELRALYRGEVHYQTGVGTGGKVDSVMGGAFGAGGEERLEAMYQDLVDAYNTADATGEHQQIDVFGFSRGAALARAFSNIIRERGIPLTGGGHVKGEDVKIRFLGAFDTVASFGWPGNDINPGKKLELPDTVCSAAHAISRHDVRGKFPVTLFADDPRVSQKWFAGVHSNIGGAYKTGKAQGYVPLYWMWMKAEEAGVPVAAFPQDKYSAIMRYRMRHDLDWNELWSDNPQDITVEPYHDSATGVLYFGDRMKRWFRGVFGGDRYKRKQYVH